MRHLPLGVIVSRVAYLSLLYTFSWQTRPVKVTPRLTASPVNLAPSHLNLVCPCRCSRWTVTSVRIGGTRGWPSRRSGTSLAELRPSIKMLDEIWKPDTFFLNGQDSYLHTITYSNKLFRIQTNGDILYSQRFLSFWIITYFQSGKQCIYGLFTVNIS